MTRYRFPESLGGVEQEAANDDPALSEVAFDLPGLPERLWLRRDCLMRVEPEREEWLQPLTLPYMGETLIVRWIPGPSVEVQYGYHKSADNDRSVRHITKHEARTLARALWSAASERPMGHEK